MRSRTVTSIAYDGVTPNKMVCDTTLRALPDGSWILFMLAGGDIEPSPLNYVGVTRSTDKGKTWTPLARFDVGFPREGKTKGQGPTELMILGDRATLFFSTHSRHWANDWRSWFLTSDDGFKTWSKPFEVPGRLKNRTFLRNHIVTRDGRILVPFQHYIGPDDEQDKDPLDRAFTNPRNGVLISADGGKTWTEHGNIRLTPNDRYFGWAENNVVELEGRQHRHDHPRPTDSAACCIAPAPETAGRPGPSSPASPRSRIPAARPPSTAWAATRSRFCTTPTASTAARWPSGSASTA